MGTSSHAQLRMGTRAIESARGGSSGAAPGFPIAAMKGGGGHQVWFVWYRWSAVAVDLPEVDKR